MMLVTPRRSGLGFSPYWGYYNPTPYADSLPVADDTSSWQPSPDDSQPSYYTNDPLPPAAPQADVYSAAPATPVTTAPPAQPDLTGWTTYNGYHFDQASGMYIDANGNPDPASVAAMQQQQQQQAAQQQAGTPSAGSTANSGGGYTYTPVTNPLLIPDPHGQGFDGGTQHFNPNFYATQSAAQQFANSLGGRVIIDPTSKNFDGTPMYAVQLADGTTVNAGAIAQVLGNDAAFPGDAQKSGEIAKMFGASYDPNIAGALRSGTTANLAPGLPAPGYSPTPHNLPQPTTQAPSPSPSSPAAPSTPATPAGAVPVSNQTATVAPGTALDVGALLSGQWFGVPRWAVLGVAALFVFSGGDQ